VSIGGTKLEILQVERTFHENVAKEIRDVQAQIADLDERMVAARSTLDHIEIRAPAAGVAVGLNAHTVGGVIKPGDYPRNRSKPAAPRGGGSSPAQ
jgi:multidrug resistance efflux pump